MIDIFLGLRGVVKSNLKYNKMSRQLGRRKHKDRPPLPKSFEQIKTLFESTEILNKYGFTLDEESKFYSGTVLSSKHSFCVFQSPKVFELIKMEIGKHQRKYLIDGTFSTAAKPFTQLLTISVQYKQRASDFKNIFMFTLLLHIDRNPQY